MKNLILLTMLLTSTVMVNALEFPDETNDINLAILIRDRHRNESSDVAWAYSVSTGPTGGYPFVDTTSPPFEFISLEVQHSSDDVIFSEVRAPNSGSMATFITPGVYFVDFNVTGFPVNSGVASMAVGVFQGSDRQVPDTLPEGNLFYSGGQYDSQLSGSLILVARKGDTIALGNGGGTGPDDDSNNLFLQQWPYANSAGATTLSTTAGINIVKLK